MRSGASGKTIHSMKVPDARADGAWRRGQGAAVQGKCWPQSEIRIPSQKIHLAADACA